MPNKSDDRRIGLNIQYIATHIKQLKNEKDTAICVRGNDEFNHFLKDEPAKVEIDFDALERFKELDKQYKKQLHKSIIVIHYRDIFYIKDIFMSIPIFDFFIISFS